MIVHYIYLEIMSRVQMLYLALTSKVQVSCYFHHPCYIHHMLQWKQIFVLANAISCNNAEDTTVSDMQEMLEHPKIAPCLEHSSLSSISSIWSESFNTLKIA